GMMGGVGDGAGGMDAGRQAAGVVAQAFRAMATGRPGPAVLECAIDVWGRSAPASANAPVLPLPPQSIDEDAIRDAAKRLAAAKRPLIVAGGGAQDAATEVAELSRLLPAPVLAYPRGRGGRGRRDP